MINSSRPSASVFPPPHLIITRNAHGAARRREKAWDGANDFSIMGERERTQDYGNEIHCHVYTFAKFQENTTVQYTIEYTISHCSVYRHNWI